jgi:hypothetical protein
MEKTIMPEINPRAAIGSNTPDAIDYAKEETERLQRDYADLAATAEQLEAEESEITAIKIPEEKETVVNLIKRIRDVKVRALGLHELEKQPHLRRGQGTDNFFFGIVDRLLKRDKKNRDGAGDRLGKILTDYDTRILAEEQERRRLEAEAAERVAAARRAEEARLAAEAEVARLAAERARKPETAAVKEQAAQQAEQAAGAATVEAKVAEAAAEEAHVATLSRPADIMRTRTSAGTLSTMQQETYAEIENPSMLRSDKLWAFVPFEAKQKALNAWARSTDWREPMPGARVGRRPKSQVR